MDFAKETCCFTGHRKIPFGKLELITQQLESVIERCINDGYRYFGAGGALGFDTIAAQKVIELKDRYPHIKLILVLPSRTQTRGWKNEDIEIYERIKLQADKIVFTSDQYFNGCMQKRNRHLVDCSTRCICYLTKNKGGTAYTVDYARKKGIDVINVANNKG